MKKQENLRENSIAAILGVVVLGACGYLFGKFVFPTLDLALSFQDLRDPDGAAFLFLWLFGLAGIPAGIATRRSTAAWIKQDQKRRKFRREFPEEAAAFAADNRERANRKRQRFLRSFFPGKHH